MIRLRKEARSDLIDADCKTGVVLSNASCRNLGGFEEALVGSLRDETSSTFLEKMEISPCETKEAPLGLALSHQRIEARSDVLVALTVPESRN